MAATVKATVGSTVLGTELPGTGGGATEPSTEGQVTVLKLLEKLSSLHERVCMYECMNV